MQFHLTFSCHDLTLPLAYNHQVQALLYKALAGTSGGAALHDGGWRAEDSRVFRLFVFGPLTAARGHYHVSVPEKRIVFADRVTLELRTPAPVLAARFAGALRPGAAFTLCSQQLTLAACEITDTAPQRSPCLVRMLSPITVHTTDAAGRRDTKDPFDAEFARLVSGNIAAKLAAFRGTGPADPAGCLAIEPVSVGIKDRQITGYKNSTVIGWRGIYRLTADPEVLAFAYNSGLGSKNAAGFGMFRLLSERERSAVSAIINA